MKTTVPDRAHSTSTSMRKMMMMMMAGLTVATMLVFVLLVVVMRLLPSLNDSAYRSLYNQGTAQASTLSSEMGGIVRSVWRTSANLNAEMDHLLSQEGATFAELQGDSQALDSFFSQGFATLRQLLGEQSVSGAFVILDAPYEAQGEDKAALYLRSALPAGDFGNASITLVRGPARLPELVDVALDKSWSRDHSLEASQRDDYYTRPMQAAQTYSKASGRDLGYWSAPLHMSASDLLVITYTMPLIGQDGTAYGVCGIELSVTNLAAMAPSGDLAYTEGFYLLAQFVNDEIVVDSAVANDRFARDFLESAAGNVPSRKSMETAAYRIHQVRDGRGQDLLIAVVDLGLYTRNSPFLDEGYSLLTIGPRSQVLEQSQSITRYIGIMLALSVLLSLAGAFTLSRYFAQRIENLATAAGNLNPERPVGLPRTKIRELDLLSNVLEQMNADVAAHAARMSTIVDSVGMPMGAFEILVPKDQVFLTDSLFRLLEIPHGPEDSQYIPFGEFRQYLPQVDAFAGEEGADFHWKSPSGSAEKWLRLKRTTGGDYIYGTVLDITEEVEQKERLEYERNYDPLTKLLNRNAYGEFMSALMKSMPEKKGVFLFGDLDNLKTVNDTFGHDAGDRYIQMAAEALSLFNREGGVVARISGDEFAVYLHGGDSREQLRSTVDRVLAEAREMQMTMPDGGIQKVRISVGLAFYPDDAKRLSDLTRYADFAMYEIKHSAKGGTREFDLESYERNSFILKKPGQLDYLLDQHRTKLAFQPIVEVRSGRVVGYEVLMRPQTREIHSPDQVISLARSQSKLPQLEKLTVLSLMDWIEDNDEELGSAMLFYNSLPSQLLDDEDYARIQQNVRRYNCHLVMEITEAEQAAPEMLQQKVEIARQLNMQIALDDFGSGYSNMINLLSIQPDFIKIDMGIIRDIDNDASRQALLKGTVEYAAMHDMETIAEGVETYDEMRTVISLGVTYIQGFYLCHPEYQLIKKLPERILTELRELMGTAKNP